MFVPTLSPESWLCKNIEIVGVFCVCLCCWLSYNSAIADLMGWENCLASVHTMCLSKMTQTLTLQSSYGDPSTEEVSPSRVS